MLCACLWKYAFISLGFCLSLASADFWVDTFFLSVAYGQYLTCKSEASPLKSYLCFYICNVSFFLWLIPPPFFCRVSAFDYDMLVWVFFIKLFFMWFFFIKLLRTVRFQFTSSLEIFWLLSLQIFFLFLPISSPSRSPITCIQQAVQFFPTGH